jgi:hypothetical protein
LGGFWKTSNSLFFITFLGDPKISKNLQKSKNETKAMPREARAHCWRIAGHPGEGLPGLKGGTALENPPKATGGFWRNLEYCVFGGLFDRSQNQQKSGASPKVKQYQVTVETMA